MEPRHLLDARAYFADWLPLPNFSNTDSAQYKLVVYRVSTGQLTGKYIFIYTWFLWCIVDANHVWVYMAYITVYRLNVVWSWPGQ